MATSPIYSWPEPDNTDLVKNGALAIRTLGNAIDTTMGTMVAKTVVDAKGDLIAGTAADTVNRLAVGSNGETLVADSSTSTGLRYQAPVNDNPVLNSAFQVWQRGTSFTASSATTGYTADRWLGYRSVAGGTISRQVTGDTTNLPNIQYCARVARDSGNTSTATINYYNVFESANSIPFAGKTVTLSFYARKGANYSSTTTNVLLTTGTGTDQNILSGFTGQTNAISSTVTPTTTWARYTYTATLATTATQISIGIIQNPLGTAGAADYLEITGVQLEVGSVATPFKTYAGTIQGELAACQRYYEKSYNDAVAPAATTDVGSIWMFQDITVTASTNVASVILYKVTKRGTPTLTIYSPVGGATGAVYNNRTGTNVSALQQYNGASNASIYANIGTTTGWHARFHYTAEAEL